MHQGRVKGYPLLSYTEPLKHERPELWERIEQKLSDEEREFFRGTIIAGSWYSRAHLHAFMDALHDATFGDPHELREVGAMAARYQVNVIYRMFLKFATPALVFRRASSVWARQTDYGSFEVVEESDDQLIGELRDDDIPIGLPDLMAGWSDTIITMLGRTPYPTEYLRVGRNCWRFTVSWVS